VPLLPDYEASCALLIGVADYPEGGDFGEVPAAIHNLSAMQRALAPASAVGFARQSCKMLANPLTAEGMRAAIKRAARIASDVLLLYYVGHGWRMDGELYLTSSSSTLESIETTGLRYATLRKIVRESSAARRIIILDCCFSGIAATGLLSADEELQITESELVADGFSDDDVDGVCVIASSGPNRPSKD